MKITKKNGGDTVALTNTTYYPVRSILEDFFRFVPVMDEMFSRSLMPNYSSLSANLWEEDDNLFVKMALPGISKENINIEIDADTIRIKGERKEDEKEESKKKYYFRSLDTQFEQIFNLPIMVDSDKAEASFENGVLTVKLPKAEQYKPKKIVIKD
jgi:HSP20 family molecular chaperone IbpA